MKKNCLRVVALLREPVQRLFYSVICSLLRGQSGYHTAVRTFCQSQRGAFVLIFAIMFSVMLGLLALQIEAPRYVYAKARLSDTLEQAALALTVENNAEGDARNEQLVGKYINAYMPGAEISHVLAGKKLDVTGTVTKVIWHPQAITRHTSWFPASEYVAGFPATVNVGGNAGARIQQVILQQQPPEAMAVVFVIDLSASMGYKLKKATPGSHDYQTKYWELKRIIRTLTENLYRNGHSQIGFVPFAVGVTEQAPDGTRRCTIPWHSNQSITDLSAIVPPLTTDRYRDWEREDRDKLYNLILNTVNVDETLKRIMDPVVDGSKISIPIGQVGYYFCQYYALLPDGYNPVPPEAELSVIPLTANIDAALYKIDRMIPLGGTFTTSGILAGVKLFRESQIKNKRLIIISDGEESHYLDTTKELITKNMCKKIKEHGIEMVFIGIEYPSREERVRRYGEQWIDWKDGCVGADHFYTPDTMQTLEHALHQAVLPKIQEEMGRNIEKINLTGTAPPARG